jgi:hypothetical protein
MRTNILHVASIAAVLGAVACSSPSAPSSSASTTAGPTPIAVAPAPITPPPQTGLTAAQTRNIQTAVQPAIALAFQKLSSSLASGFSFRDNGREPLVHPESTQTISGSAACPQSGTVSVTGVLTDNTNSSGTGTAGINMQIGFSNCSSAGIILRGNPNMTLGAQYKFSNFQLVNPLTFTMGGGISFVLDGVNGTIAFNCSGNIDVNSFAVSEAGTVTLQYPTGQNTTTMSCASF